MLVLLSPAVRLRGFWSHWELCESQTESLREDFMEGKSLNLNEAYINSTAHFSVNSPGLTTVLQITALLLEKVARRRA